MGHHPVNHLPMGLFMIIQCRRRCREDYMKLLKYFNHSGMTPDMKIEM